MPDVVHNGSTNPDRHPETQPAGKTAPARPQGRESTRQSDGRPSPARLWAEAGGDGTRYRALLVEHGHLVPGRSGPTSLPCGWPGNRRAAQRVAGEAALIRIEDAEAAYAAAISAARGDADLIAAANRTFEAAIEAADRELDEALAAINAQPTEETR